MKDRRITLKEADFFNMAMANWIKKYRKLNKISLREVADVLGVSHVTITHYENYECEIPNESFLKLCQMFHIDPIEAYKEIALDYMNIVSKRVGL
jgi:transcriptional regulator with XRE-family HTH domain